MKIPKKISPDQIKDSIIELRYSSALPFEVAIGLFYKALDDTYTYSNRPIRKRQIASSRLLNINQEITLSLGNQHLFYNDKIQIQFHPNSIIFNCLNDYISWSNYQPEIKKVLSQLKKADVIEKYNRIGIRYITEYPNTDLKNCVKFAFTFGMPQIESKTYSFSSQFDLEKFTVILNLKNKLPVLVPKDTSNSVEITPVSTIDIDIFDDKINETDLDNLLTQVDIIHQKEKEFFFNLLNEEFLKTLNPEY